MTVFREAYRTVVPRRDNPHGPLPVLLVLLTVVTGLVDAFSYLQLGHVFVANMTGNVVFLAFALGGAPGFVWWASLLAIVCFSAGALVTGRIRKAHGGHRGRLLLVAAGLQAVLVVAAAIVAAVPARRYGAAVTAVLIVLLAVGMGMQNQTARALAVPDLTTTVLTLTITGISADSALVGGPGSHAGRRLVSIGSMFAGALAGVLLVRAGHPQLVLLAAALLLIAVTVAAGTTVRSAPAWAGHQ